MERIEYYLGLVFPSHRPSLIKWINKQQILRYV